MNFAYIDIGELDFSIRLSAYMKWFHLRGCPAALVMTYPDRRCLYEGWVDKVVNVPDEFYRDFDIRKQWGSRVGGIARDTQKEEREEDKRENKIFFEYFNKKLPEGYCVSKEMSFIHGFSEMMTGKNKLFIPYPYGEQLVGKKEILIFPRARQTFPQNNRNIPKIFYIKLIDRLCGEFKDYIIRTMGLKFAAYDIVEIEKDNYINSVEENSSFQKMINRCQLAVGAIGSHSTPLLFTMLQGVPSFIVGRDREKIERDNWLRTRFYFFGVGRWIFAEWKDEKKHAEAIDKAVLFFKNTNENDCDSRRSSIIYKGV